MQQAPVTRPSPISGLGALPVRVQDGLLLFIMMALAGAGLIYEYLLSHYAGRVLGLMEHAIFTMIGVMIVSMGVGALAAKKIRDPERAFLVLELGLALTGALAVLAIAGVFALSAEFPRILGETFGLPHDVLPRGGAVLWMERFARLFPFIAGFVVGVLVGMEIPLIARLRERLYAAHLTHNTGTVYGLDYIGAGLGAAVFVGWLLAVPPEQASLWVALINLAAGLAFLALRWATLAQPANWLALHLGLAAVLVLVNLQVSDWRKLLEQSLYEDRVIFSTDTEFQHITLTERRMAPDLPADYSLFLNGRTQFCSCDERIYHSMLVDPVMMASARRDELLLIGGGDGLALRDMLKWNPQKVTVLELDREMIRLFSEPVEVDGELVNGPLLALNQGSFADPRVELRLGDAFNSVDRLLAEGRRFDAIIIDLPDPSHPDLNKLYSRRFYAKVRNLLAGDGAISIQSTSPYHARDAFLTVGVTLEAAGFGPVERLRANVPTFGEWGWTIAVADGRPPSQRIAEDGVSLPDGSWATPELIQGAFAFPRGFLDRARQLEPNTLGNQRMYLLHYNAWQRREFAVSGTP